MKPRALLTISIAALVLGVLLTVHAVHATAPAIDGMEKTLATLTEVEQLAAEHATDWAAVERFNALPQKSPRSLENIASSISSDDMPEIRTRGTREAAGGWTLRSINVTFDDIPLTDLSRFIDNASADTERPPWILRECTITASEGTTGNGRAVLVMEALEKKSGTR